MNEIKQGYKQTDIGIIPEDWEIVQLGKISTNMGYGVGASAINYDGINKYIRITDIDDETRSFIPAPISSPSFYNDSHIVNEGDILFARTGASVGKSYIYNKKDGKLIIAGFLIRLNIYDAFPKYVYFHTFAKRYKEWVISESARTGQPGLNLEQYKSFEIPLPKDIIEQTAIANTLSNVDALIAALDKKIVKKQQIKQGAMQQLLTGKKRVAGFSDDWIEKSLGDIAEIKDGTHQTPHYVNDGIPFFSVESVTNNDFKKVKTISIEEHKFLTKTFKIEKGDVLMTRIGSIGVCKFVDWELDASFYVSLALLKFKKGYSSKYFTQYSKTSEFNKEIEEHSLQHATPKKINLGKISLIKVNIPASYEEQSIIAKILTAMDTEIEKLVAERNKYKEIKAGMMQQLLTGKIRLIHAEAINQHA